MITPDQLTEIAPSIKGQKAVSISASLNKICPQYGINTSDIFHEYIANVLVECKEFTQFEENLHYSSESLINNFGRHRISMEQALLYGKNSEHGSNPKAIANIIYGGEFGKNQLGNEQPTDGWDFRGSGPIQLTGRNNHTAFNLFYADKFKNRFTVNEMASFLRGNTDMGIHSACWLFSIAKNLIQLAINDDMKAIVKKINGGYNGMDLRMAYYIKAQQVIV